MKAPETYYMASAARAPTRPRLTSDLKTDICVVGGGYTGLSAALHLAARGAKVTLIEAETIGFAASGRNGGQIHTGLRKDQAELERWLGAAHARDLWRLTEEAKSLVRELIAAHGIDCALKDGLVIAAHNDAAARALTADTRHLWSAYSYTKARMMDARETSQMLGTNIYPAARFDAGGGHLHPLNFALGLAAAAEAAGATLFEHSPARVIEQTKDNARIVCEGGTITADRVILACDAFTASVAPELAPFIAHVESFIVATGPLSAELNARILPRDAAVADTRHVLDYYRKADGRMLFAGREAYFSLPSDIARLVRPRMKRVFPALADIPIEYAWSGTVGITRTRMPHFGRVGERALFAHGYSGQGVALAVMGGKLLAEASLGETERFDVFARVPAQPFPGGAMLRKPLVAAALTWFKLIDRF